MHNTTMAHLLERGSVRTTVTSKRLRGTLVARVGGSRLAKGFKKHKINTSTSKK